MNTELPKSESVELPPLPSKSIAKREFTFAVPHILKSFTIDDAGFRHQDVRQGISPQIDFEMETEFSDTPVDETKQVFAIRATNQLNFGNTVINVINDKIELPNFRLVPTSPTATEYLEKVGKRVMVSFNCRVHRSLSQQQGKTIYQINRTFITLP